MDMDDIYTMAVEQLEDELERYPTNDEIEERVISILGQIADSDRDMER